MLPPLCFPSFDDQVNVNDETEHASTRKTHHSHANCVTKPLNPGNRERQLNSFILETLKAAPTTPVYAGNRKRQLQLNSLNKEKPKPEQFVIKELHRAEHLSFRAVARVHRDSGG